MNVPCIGSEKFGMRVSALDFIFVMNKYTENDMMGFGLIAAGAMLIMYGMNLLGDVAAMEDEQAAQEAKNAEIDAARARMLDREEQKRRAKEKIIKYRMRTKQIEEEEAAERRRQLQESATGGAVR